MFCQPVQMFLLSAVANLSITIFAIDEAHLQHLALLATEKRYKLYLEKKLQAVWVVWFVQVVQVPQLVQRLCK